MIRFLFILCLISTCLSAAAQNADKPKLVVGVIVDQMRYEYLHRFENHYSDGGFKKMLANGYSFRNAHFNYIPTKTGPGHASVYTGTTPRVHGVIANDWYDKFQEKMVYCVEDLEATGVGAEGKIGMRSPKNMLSSTMTDELKIHYQNKSKVIGISIKDRGSILPAGHNPDGAYWFDDKTGIFLTSTFYTEKLPNWVVEFNQRKLSSKYTNGSWETFADINTYVESARDDRMYENAFFMDLKPVFPYDLKAVRKTFGIHKTAVYSPYGNTLTVDFAEAAITAEQLGADDITDFLAISFSSTDKIGHEFGPYSKEIQDTYVRLDRDMERLIKILDEQVGEGNWVMFLTADHAIAELPAYLEEQGQFVGYFNNKEYKPLLNKLVDEKFAAKGIIENISNRQIFLNKDVVKEHNLDISSIKNFLIDLLLEMEGVNAAYATKELILPQAGNSEVTLLSAGYNARISGDIAFTLLPNWLSDYNLYHKGTNHATGYSYDTHVPMIFYGWGIKQGSTVNYHPITDIAPTICALLNIKFPSGCTGQPASELFE